MDNTPLTLEQVRVTLEQAGGLHVGHIGEDGERAFALGHHDDTLLLQVLTEYLDDDEGWLQQGTVTQGWVTCTPHRGGCDGDDCCCNEYAWWADGLQQRQTPGAIAVTEWSV